MIKGILNTDVMSIYLNGVLCTARGVSRDTLVNGALKTCLSLYI